MDVIKVGISEYRVEKYPAVLMCVGLGSCIGIALYDKFKKIGGLAHIMLPREGEAKDKSNPAKFADKAIDLMLSGMKQHGCLYGDIKAKIFGGANMFPGIKGSTPVNIGEKNAAAALEELEKRKIKLTALDLGGNFGRTITLDLKDGSVLVRMVSGEEKMY